MFGLIPPETNVSLNNPEITFRVISEHHKGKEIPDSQLIYFGMEICSQNENSLAKYELSQRTYLGPTSTDHELALLMCNQALVAHASLIYDPFVGTAGILIAATHWG